MNHFFKGAGLLLIIGFLVQLSILPSWAQSQDFEGAFSTSSYPEPFLPGWYANEFRSSSSRVFRLTSGGIEG